MHVCMPRVLTKDGMRLYRHSTECPAAIQMFLDENPQYWRFAPMPKEEAEEAMQNIGIATRDISSIADIRTDDEVKILVGNLPPPPANYQFSTRQRHHQFFYFQTRRDQKTMPNSHLDLYNARIVAVRECYRTQSKLCRFLTSPPLV